MKKTEKMKKETIKRKGVCRVYDDDSVEFAPYGEGAAIQKDVKKVRKSTMYETDGENSNYIVHLKVDKNAIDPASELADDFEKLVKNLDPKREPALRGRTLLTTDNCTVVLNKPRKAIEIRIQLDLTPDRSYKEELFNTNFEIQKCFTTNKSIIASAMKSRPKSGQESSTTEK